MHDRRLIRQIAVIEMVRIASMPVVHTGKRTTNAGRMSASVLDRMLQVSISVLKVPMRGHAFSPCSIPCQVLCRPPVLENYNEYFFKRALYCLLFHWFRAVRHSFLLAPRGYVNWQVYSEQGTESKNQGHSLECGHLLIHGLDWSRVPHAVHQLDCMEQK